MVNVQGELLFVCLFVKGALSSLVHANRRNGKQFRLILTLFAFYVDYVVCSTRNLP